MGWFFSDYRVSPNFLLCWGWVVVEVGLGCDNIFESLMQEFCQTDVRILQHYSSLASDSHQPDIRNE